MIEIHYYTDEELAQIRKDLKENNKSMQEIVRKAGVKLHPKIAEARKKRKQEEKDNDR